MKIGIEVAVEGPFPSALNYWVDLNETIPTNTLIGRRVLVPLGHRKVIGIILKIADSEAEIATKLTLKSVEKILDDSPLFEGALFSLLLWMSDYYAHTIGNTFQTALLSPLNEPEPFTLPVRDIYELTPDGKIALSSEKPFRSARQKALLEKIAAGICDKASLSPFFETSITPALSALLEKAWISRTLSESPAKLTGSITPPQSLSAPLALSEEQLAALKTSLQTDSFQVQLLEGVTGSGKTEVYLQRIAPVLAQGKQVLILVPEIGLTPQTLERFQSRFSVPTVLIHSGKNETERKQALFYAKNGEAKMIIGTRSAVFVPTQQLGMIIVDEEHDLSFKQQNGLRYHARDVAIKRAQLENIPILLGSATPSLESLHNVQKGKYVSLSLKERAKGKMPQFYCLDLKAQPSLKDGLTEALLSAMRRHLKAGNQVLIFINRRGFAPVLMCHQCQWQAKCPRCEKPYTLHVDPLSLHCHHCGTQKKLPSLCPNCEDPSGLSDVGIGTEKIERALQNHFPDLRILRIDRSNTRQKNAMESHLSEIQSGKAHILVGTQMLAKGHHFENLTCVGILKIDEPLFSNDFRATEHLAQLLAQVSGRCGRGDSPGEVFIQTHHPDHPLFQILLSKGYHPYAQSLLEERKNSGFPPFSHLALIRAESHHPTLGLESLETLKQGLRPFTENSGVEWLGPFPSFLAKRAGIYRSGLLIQAPERGILHRAVKRLMAYLRANPIKKVRLSVDIDPIDWN